MHKRAKEVFWVFAGIIACANLSVFDSLAQDYPVKPIRLIVGYTAGGATDASARIVAQKASEPLGQPMIVENRPGASGAIATQRVATSPPDGYTLLMMTAADTMLPTLRAKLPYDLERDFAPVSLVVIAPFVLVIHPSVPARNVEELIALARSQPSKLSYGTSGVGGSLHLMAELFNLMAKVNTVHVPYKGASEAVIANASGQIDMSFLSIATALPLIKAGRLTPLAVTLARRATLMPSIPTLDESGLRGYDRSSWYGVVAPAGVSKNVVARLNAAIGKVVDTPEVKESFNRLGLEPQTNTPEQFAAHIHREIAQNAKLIKLIGLKPE